MRAKHLTPLYSANIYYPVSLSSFSFGKNDSLETDLLQVSTVNSKTEVSNNLETNFAQVKSFEGNITQYSENVQLNSGIHICFEGTRYIHPSCIPLPFDVPKPEAKNNQRPKSTKPKIEHFFISSSLIQKRKRKEKRPNRVCYHCGSKDTTHWRCGPNGKNTLCNACGLQYSKVLRKTNQCSEKGKIAHIIN